MKYFESLHESNKKVLKISALVLLVIIFAIIFFYIRSHKGMPLGAKTYDYRSALQSSVGGEDPKPLQDFFIEKVKSGTKDNEAKSAIYWIVHRYFDNGGNIYEIYVC